MEVSGKSEVQQRTNAGSYKKEISRGDDFTDSRSAAGLRTGFKGAGLRWPKQFRRLIQRQQPREADHTVGDTVEFDTSDSDSFKADNGNEKSAQKNSVESAKTCSGCSFLWEKKVWRWVAQAFLCAGITSLLVLVSPLNQLFDGTGYWAVQSAVVVLEATTGASVKKSIERILGTIVGGTGAYAFFMLITWNERYRTHTYAVILLGLFVCVWPLPWGYIRVRFPNNPLIATYGTFTGYVVVIPSFIQGNASQLVALRISAVAAGLLVAAFVTHFVFPSSARESLNQSVANSLECMSDILDFLIEREAGIMQAGKTLEDFEHEKATLKDIAQRRRHLRTEKRHRKRNQKKKPGRQNTGGRLPESNAKENDLGTQQQRKRTESQMPRCAGTSAGQEQGGVPEGLMKAKHDSGAVHTLRRGSNAGGVQRASRSYACDLGPIVDTSLQPSQKEPYQVLPAFKRSLSRLTARAESQRGSYAVTATPVLNPDGMRGERDRTEEDTVEEFVDVLGGRGSGLSQVGPAREESFTDDDSAYRGYLRDKEQIFDAQGSKEGCGHSRVLSFLSSSQEGSPPRGPYGVPNLVDRQSGIPAGGALSSDSITNNTAASQPTDGRAPTLIAPSTALLGGHAGPTGGRSSVGALDIPGSLNRYSSAHSWTMSASSVGMAPCRSASNVSQLSTFYREQERELDISRIKTLNDVTAKYEKVLYQDIEEQKRRWGTTLEKFQKCQNTIGQQAGLLIAAKQEIACCRAGVPLFPDKRYATLLAHIGHLFHHIASLFFSLHLQLGQVSQARKDLLNMRLNAANVALTASVRHSTAGPGFPADRDPWGDGPCGNPSPETLLFRTAGEDKVNNFTNPVKEGMELEMARKLFAEISVVFTFTDVFGSIVRGIVSSICTALRALAQAVVSYGPLDTARASVKKAGDQIEILQLLHRERRAIYAKIFTAAAEAEAKGFWPAPWGRRHHHGGSSDAQDGQCCDRSYSLSSSASSSSWLGGNGEGGGGGPDLQAFPLLNSAQSALQHPQGISDPAGPQTTLPWDTLMGIDAESFKEMSKAEHEVYWDSYWLARDRLSVTTGTLILLKDQLGLICDTLHAINSAQVEAACQQRQRRSVCFVV